MLPEHVAVKMRQDLGTAHDGQFKKIYMSRHENVRLVLFFVFVSLSDINHRLHFIHCLYMPKKHFELFNSDRNKQQNE